MERLLEHLIPHSLYKKGGGKVLIPHLKNTLLKMTTPLPSCKSKKKKKRKKEKIKKIGLIGNDVDYVDLTPEIGP